MSVTLLINASGVNEGLETLDPNVDTLLAMKHNTNWVVIGDAFVIR